VDWKAIFSLVAASLAACVVKYLTSSITAPAKSSWMGIITLIVSGAPGWIKMAIDTAVSWQDYRLNRNKLRDVARRITPPRPGQFTWDQPIRLDPKPGFTKDWADRERGRGL
jgi:hypothetical protein